MGRPTDYKKEYNEQAYKLCLLGSTDKQLADFFGVSEQTINTWKQKHPKFLESLRRGKDEADARVGESLYQRATGYNAKEKRVTKEGEKETVTEIDKQYPPDTTAGIFWLKNRRPGHWRDKQEVEHSGLEGLAEALARRRERAKE